MTSTMFVRRHTHGPCYIVTTSPSWVQPDLVGEIVYRQFTRAGRVRHTAWRGLSRRQEPADVLAPRSVHAPAAASAAKPGPAESASQAPVGRRITVQAGDRRLTSSNLGKPLYPDGFSKGEVIDYYSHIANVLLPHLPGRPATFIRFPDGVGGAAVR
ncbi:hypothetical protein [Amycolatopsis sp. NPDC051102]|uniref:non-homologous end-joining DNA ligase LigD n=1 Tax=Amycolatopsis sp. NPDC051102 TaxID=3155163 RepID=UPI00341F0D7C